MENKKGSSLAGFAEAGIGVIIILMIFALVIIPELNIKYGYNHDSTFGLSTNETRASFEDYQDTLKAGMESEASTNTYSGVSLSGAWGMTKAGLGMILDMVTGQFILNAVGLLNLGVAGTWLGWGLRLLFIFAVAFILMRIIFKVNA